MAQNVAVVALFENAQRAATVVEELTRRGFRRDQVELTTSQSASNRDALHGHLTGLGAPAREAQFWTQGVHGGGTLITVHTSEDRVEEAREILNRLGARNLDDDTVARTGTTGAAGTMAATTGTRTDTSTDKTVIPIVEEQLTVGKRQVEHGGVRVLTRVTETPVQEQVTLREEHVTVDRRPVDRVVSEADRANFSDRTIDVTTTAEEAVVSKQARVVEEVVIGKEASQRTETVQDTVRRTEVDVEELNTADRPVNTTAGTTTDPTKRRV